MNAPSLNTPTSDPGASSKLDPTPERHREAVKQWRANTLAKRPRPARWVILGAVVVILMIASLLVPDPITRAVAGAVVLIGGAIDYRRLWKLDIACRTLARLTPVVDRSALQSQIHLVKVAVLAMFSTLQRETADQSTRIISIHQVLVELDTLLARGGSSIAGIAGSSKASPKRNAAENLALAQISDSLVELNEVAEERLVFVEHITQIAASMTEALHVLEKSVLTRPPSQTVRHGTQAPPDLHLVAGATSIDSIASTDFGGACDGGGSCD